MMWSILVLMLVLFGSSSLGDHVVVQTKSGPVRGQSVRTLFDQKSYFSFRGIPFAEEPVNELRFKPPVAVRKWTEVRDALNYGNICSQLAGLSGEPDGDEDCLFLNIFTPDVKPTKKLAVMFFIHGGGFYEGSGNDDLLGPDFLINDNVILVTTNYRLGVFGFVSLGTADYSGNMGLKDQQLSLQWINDNIESFGGDRERITLFGHSAGGVSVHYHVLLSSSKGLFQRAIMMSGVALNPWALSEHSNHMLDMYAFANGQKLDVTSYSELVKFLKEVDAKSILDKVDLSAHTDVEKGTLLKYLPVIEGVRANKPILQSSAAEIYEHHYESNVDVMLGFVTAEWLFQMGPQMEDPTLLESLDEHFEILLPYSRFHKHYYTEEFQEMLAEIRNFYFGEDVSINNETLDVLTDLLSDVFFAYGIDKSATTHAKKSAGKTFYYRFAVDANLNMMKKRLDMTSLDGTTHADELCYLFRCHNLPGLYDNVTENSVEMSVIRSTVRLWTNFAKFGNPTPNGKPVNFQPIAHDAVHFLDIQNEGLFTAENPNNKNNRFWDELLERYDEIFSYIGAVKDEL